MRSLLRHKPYLRCLSKENRRKWFEQHKRLTPRVRIACIPDAVTRQYAYVQLAD